MEENDPKKQNCCLSVLKKIQAPEILEDDLGKAKSFRLCSIRRPHMRGFHTSWFTFFIAFTAWFGIQPLIPTIRKELCLDKTTVAHSGTASISATIFVRIVVGPLCDMFGPRRVMSGLLIVGAIPMACAGLIQSGTGLIIVRLFIGILGGTFIPCQFWTSAFFNVKIVGTANALVGGWGNLGGGFTFLLMPVLFELMKKFGADEFLAWKLAVLIPALKVFGFGVLILWTSDDCPQGHWTNRKLPMDPEETVSLDKSASSGIIIAYNTTVDEKNETEKSDKGVVNMAFTLGDEKVEEFEKQEVEQQEKKDEEKPVTEGDSKTCGKCDFWLYFTVTVLVIQYGLCFGLEIAVNTVMNLYFLYNFKKDGCVENTAETVTQSSNMTTLMSNITTTITTTTESGSCSLQSKKLDECSILDQNTASLIASLFGLTNLFSRALGGLFSDLLLKYLGLSGRLLAHFICLTGEGIMLIIFSRMTTIPNAIGTMIVFSIFVQMSEGTTFAIVPYVNPRRVGVIAGFIGAGGNAGAMIWNSIWSQLVEVDPSRWFWILGICVLAGNVLTLLIQVQKARIWGVRPRKSSKYDFDGN